MRCRLATCSDTYSTKGSSARSTNYDDLAARAERGELTVKPGTVRRGSEAVAEAQRNLIEATGATSLDELTRITLGRPSVGAKGGASP